MVDSNPGTGYIRNAVASNYGRVGKEVFSSMIVNVECSPVWNDLFLCVSGTGELCCNSLSKDLDPLVQHKYVIIITFLIFVVIAQYGIQKSLKWRHLFIKEI